MTTSAPSTGARKALSTSAVARKAFRKLLDLGDLDGRLGKLRKLIDLGLMANGAEIDAFELPYGERCRNRCLLEYLAQIRV